MSEPAIAKPKLADVDLVAPDGTPGTVPAEQVEDALRQGFRMPGHEAPPTKEEVFSSPVAGAALGVLRGATAGLSDVALASNPWGRAIAEGSKEANPISTGVGEFAGMVASPLNALGEAAVGPAASTALGRIVQHGVSGTISQGLMGAGNAVSESALGDERLTAEKLFSSAGMGAVLGSAGGLLGGALGEGVKKIASSAEASGLLDRFARSQAFRAMGGTQRDLSSLGPEKSKAMLDMMLERGHLGEGAEAPRATDVLRSVTKDLDAQGATIGKIIEDAHANGATPSYSEMLARLDSFEKGINPLEREAIAPRVDSVRKALLDMGSKPLGPDNGFLGLNRLKGTLQDSAKWQMGEDSVLGGLKRQLAGTFRDELDRQLLPQLGSDTAQQFDTARTLYGQLSDAQRVAQHGADRLGGNATLGIRDLGVGIGAGLLHGNPVTGLASAFGYKLLRERGPAIAARLANAISENGVLSTVAEHFASAVSRTAPVAFGEFRQPLLAAAAESPQSALATHLVLNQAFPEQYPAEAAKAGFPLQAPEQEAAALDRARGLTALKGVLSAHDEQIGALVDKAIRGGKDTSPDALKTQDFGAKGMRQDAVSGYQTRADEIRSLASNPAALAGRVAANLGPVATVAPMTATALAETASRAIAYLNSKLPQTPPAAVLTQDEAPSPAEAQAFAAALQAAQQPLSVLHQAAAGTLTPQAVQAVQAIYPRLYAQIQRQVVSALAEKSGTVPYRRVVQLAQLTGLDFDGTMSQASIAHAQAASTTPAPPRPVPRRKGVGEGFSQRRKLDMDQEEA